MAKYFIDTENCKRGKKQPPRKVILTNISSDQNSETAVGYDADGGAHTLKLVDILDDNDNPIKDARMRLNLTRAELAEKLRITEQAIGDWEDGNVVPPESFMSMVVDKIFSLLETK